MDGMQVFNSFQEVYATQAPGSQSAMAPFNPVAVENATFWLNGQEIKLEQIDDSRPYKQRLKRIDAIDNSVTQSVLKHVLVGVGIPPNTPFERTFDTVALDGLEATIQGLANQFWEEANDLREELNIEARPESLQIIAMSDS